MRPAPFSPIKSRRARGPSLLVATSVLLAGAAQADSATNGLLDLSLSELLHLEVTTASKRAQSVAETAAAVFVITRDDIRRSGARSIPEALRMAPGLEVAQIDANKWAISARGFNGRFANKLLVLMDGRALYTPSFGGVFWDVQDTIMDEIDRIEVIRGPGGALWGANAVNGVINVITRTARDAQGGEAILAAEDGPGRSGSIRYGGTMGPAVTYRAHAKYSDGAGNETTSGALTADGWHLGRAGGRVEWVPAEDQLWTVSSEGYTGQSGETLARSLVAPPYTTTVNTNEQVSGFFTNLQWEKAVVGGGELQAKLYYDNTDRQGMLFGERRDTAALEFQYHFHVGPGQDVVTGTGLRRNSYRFSTTGSVVVTPTNPSDVGYNAFVQDEIRVIADHLSLTLGVDLEHNALSENNLDALPSGRLLWTLNEQNHAWAAVTKAISTPSYEQTSASVTNAAPVQPPGSAQNPFPVPLSTNFIGTPRIRSEQLLAYELGYRTQVVPAVTLDTSVFLHKYSKLRGEATTNVYCAPSGISVAVDPTCLYSATNVVNLIQFTNDISGQTRGVEVAADWAATSRMRLRAAYTYLNMDLHATSLNPALVFLAAFTEQQNPRNQVYVRADWTVAPQIDLSLSARHIGRVASDNIPSYSTADANLAWQLTPKLSVALTGHNLLQPSHQEFVSELDDVVPTRIERTFGARLRVEF